MIRSIRVIRVQTLSFAALHAEGAENGGEDSISPLQRKVLTH